VFKYTNHQASYLNMFVTK